MTVHIDFAAQRNCYALAWSYGEICVGCGCCALPSKERDEARLLYWQDQLEEHLNFNHWMKGMKRLQRRNNKDGIRYCSRRVRLYMRKMIHWLNLEIAIGQPVFPELSL